MSELLHRALKSAPASARYKQISPENESEIRHVTRSPLKKREREIMMSMPNGKLWSRKEVALRSSLK